MLESVIVIDDALPEIPSINIEDIDWYDLEEDHPYKVFCLTILHLAGQYADLSDTIGYEFWSHNDGKLEWHQDKDENLCFKEDKLEFPTCSTVYYSEVSKLRGGELLLGNDMVIIPKPNRLVIFQPGIYHTVKPYKGKRVSLNVNPWSHPLCQ